jgi:hypothetical protein
VREIRTEIVIRAGAGTVWSILLDFPAYPEWNPFVTRIRGKPVVGERLECRPRLPGSRRALRFRPTVTHLTPERVFAWKGHTLLPGLADGEHFLELEPLGRDRVRLVHRQEYWGVLMPLFWVLFAARARQGFRLMNEALKARAEEQERAKAH